MKRKSNLLVWLDDGPNNFSGNVYAKNPLTNISGPVCDDFWSLADVSPELIGNKMTANIRTGAVMSQANYLRSPYSASKFCKFDHFLP